MLLYQQQSNLSHSSTAALFTLYAMHAAQQVAQQVSEIAQGIASSAGDACEEAPHTYDHSNIRSARYPAVISKITMRGMCISAMIKGDSKYYLVC